MTRKILISIGMALFLLIAQFGTVLAAQGPTPITGTVETIALETDATTGETTVVVTVREAAGTTQTVRLSLETAQRLGLVSTDLATGQFTVNPAAEGTTVNIDPAAVILDPAEETTAQHPVGAILANFFSDLGVDYDTIMEYHDDGVGFGLIAQALWMTNKLEGDAAAFEMILDAKLSGDYTTVILADGSTPQNWGQFKKAVMGTGKKENLGTIMSDKDQEEGERVPPGQQNKDKNKDKKDKNKNKP